ncbi:MAG: hypothetical protein K2Y05_11790 [Hyphomicrobiaceae bacterium]|nr:hypothetical protein [Hyphomicrobiaceae bacterium]
MIPVTANKTLTISNPEAPMAAHDRTRKDARKDTVGFRMIYAATFTIFLVAAIADRLIPLRWMFGAAGSESYLGFMSEAQRAAETYTPFAFMG